MTDVIAVPLRVVLVEYEPDLRTLYRVGLESAGCVVQEAATGDEALRLTAAILPDVVVIDLILDRVSGVDLCRAIRVDPALRTTPRVMITRPAGAAVREMMRGASADAVLSKPIANSSPSLCRVARRRIAGGRRFAASDLVRADGLDSLRP